MDFYVKTLTPNIASAIANILQAAAQLGMDISGDGEIGYNDSSCNVYILCEDYPFTLFQSEFGSIVYALWSDPFDGEEHEIDLSDLDGNILDGLYKWVEELEKAAEERDEN